MKKLALAIAPRTKMVNSKYRVSAREEEKIIMESYKLVTIEA